MVKKMPEANAPSTFVIPHGMTGTFGVVRLWPGVNNAEVEVIARLKRAARILGLKCVEITPDGYLLDTPKVKATPEDFDFAIHLHFDTPKAYNLFSFVALWNPLRYYYEYREGEYRRFSDNLLSHDDFLSCDSPGADDHVRRLIHNDPQRHPPLFTLFHSLAEPLLPPGLGDRKLFYVGINWERLRGEKSRNQELLDMMDKSGRLRIYGPRRFLGVNVWRGYKSYVGEIPFDGVSIVKEIASAGISLVLSSSAHKESGLMSNRLFESLAAGAVIICDENAFARKHFGDTLLYVNTNEPPDVTHQQIREHLRWIDNNPEEALDLARRAQDIFRAGFTLDRSLAQIYNRFAERKAALAQPYALAETPPVTLFLLLPVYDKSILQQHIDSAASQTYPNLRCVLLIDNETNAKFGKLIMKQCQHSGVAIELRAANLCAWSKNGKFIHRHLFGPVLYELLQTLSPGGLFCVVDANETLFSGHIHILVKTLLDHAHAGSAYASAVIKYNKGDNEEYRIQNSLDPFGFSKNQPFGKARFLFRNPPKEADLAPVLLYLNDKAAALMVLQAGAAPSRRATVFVDSRDTKHDECACREILFEDEIIRDFMPKAVLDRYDAWPSSRGLRRSIDLTEIDKISVAERLIILKALFSAMRLPAFLKRFCFWFYRQLRRFS